MAQDKTTSGHRAVQEREPALQDRYYERCAREVRFYREIGVAFAPQVYYAAADHERRRVALLLEDVSGGRQGDVLEGCSIEDAAAVLEHLAPFHARWWGARAPAGFERLGVDPKARQERYAGQMERFVERYGEDLPPELGNVVRLLRSRLGDIAIAMEDGARTLVHGDLHLDNMIFAPTSDSRPVVVLDWQTASVGPPAWDVGLFLFGSLSVEDRRAAEAELLDRYLTLLTAHGVPAYSMEDLRFECQLALLVLLAGTIVWLTTLERADLTGRERALHQTALANGRLVAALLDHDVESLLARPLPSRRGYRQPHP